MRALITGGLGFIGCNLADRLLRGGWEVAAFDNAGRPGVRHNLAWLRARHPKSFTWIEGDVRDFAAVARAVQGAERVFHLAGQVAVTSSVADPRGDFDINAGGSLNVLEAARLSNPQPIVLYTSTNKVYGGMENLRIREAATRYEFADYPQGIAESFPTDFHSPYGCSKGAADQYVRDYARIFGLRTIVFRMSCIYGPRQFGNEDQGWLAHFVLALKRGQGINIYGDGKQVRDLLHIDDLAAAMLAATEDIDATAGRIYNIGGGPANALSVWVECGPLLEKTLNVTPQLSAGPWRPGDQRVYISDIRRAHQEFGWRPAISPAQGIRSLADWADEALALLGHAARPAAH